MYALDVLVAITLFLLALGVGLWLKAWRYVGGSTAQANTAQANTAQANKVRADRAQLLGSLAAGVLTGACAAAAVLALQQWLSVSSAYTVWRANVETAADIPGFTPGTRSLQGLNLSGKQLEDADLRGADLTGVVLNDTDLRGALFRKANLQGVNMIGANLATAELPDANLSGAQLQAARFDDASVWDATFAEFKNGKWIRAIANAETCWPKGFLESSKAKQIMPGPDHNYSSLGLSRGFEQPYCKPTHWPASVLR
jgi:uncharacterized protein YjbI with pentapeptide repeats